MKYYLVAILSLGILGGLCAPLRAQTAVDGRLLYVPAALLAAGIYVETAPGNAFFSKRQLHHHFTGGHHENDWDDYAQFVPLGAAVGMLVPTAVYWAADKMHLRKREKQAYAWALSPIYTRYDKGLRVSVRF